MRISKYIAVLIVIAIIWSMFFVWIWNYGEELRQHPCSLCAKKIGENITCISYSQDKMIFDSEGGIEVINNEPIRSLPSYKG